MKDKERRKYHFTILGKELMMNIPFSKPDISELEIDQVTEVLKSGWITTGNKTKKLEKEVAKFCEVH